MESSDYSYKNDWNEIYSNHLYGENSLPWLGIKIDTELNLFIDSIPRDASIIDIGCGDGSLCEHLASNGFTDVLGIDVSDLIISHVMASSTSGAQYRVLDVFDLSDDEKYDIVFCRWLLHHMIPTDKVRLLKKLNAILKPGGKLYLSFLSTDLLEFPYKERVSHFTSEHRVMMYNPQHVKDTLQDMGLINLLHEGSHQIDNNKYPEKYYVLIYKKANDNNANDNLENSDNYQTKIQAIKDIIYKKPSADTILDFLKDYINKQDVSDSDVLVFSMALDAISSKLYIRGNEDQEAAPLVELDDFTNDDQTGYFDRIFELASKLIFKLIDEPDWNIILKMDVHNESTGLSKFSVVSQGSENVIVHYKEAQNSKAFTLFSNYKRFCYEQCNAKALSRPQIYSVHKEFADDKALRFISYTNNNEEKKLNKYFSCSNPVTVDSSSANEIGQKLFLQFIKCTLDNLLPEDGRSDNNQSFYDYSRNVFNDDTKTNRLRSQTPHSFSFINIGIPGFESWATLMIEGLKEDKSEVNCVYNRFFVGDLDRPVLAQINSIISIIKKIDDEFNDARNKQRVKNEAKKSAKAAIMSRNMSHNLGSHVMSYLKHQLSSMPAILHKDSHVLFNVDDLLDKTYGGDSNKQYPDDKIQTPFLLGMGRFVAYLQERQDYIATIATDYIPYGAPVNLKDAVYDELNPDLRYLRHGKFNTSDKSKKSDDTRNRPFNILLNYIIKSEGFSRENVKNPDSGGNNNARDIIFKFLTYDIDGNPLVFSGLDNKEKDTVIQSSEDNKTDINNSAQDENKEKENPALSAMRKVNFSLPGGLVGRQALFSIFENLMRNAAKHGKTNELAGGLEFTLDVIPLRAFAKDENGSYLGTKIEERVTDSKWRNLYENSLDINSQYLLTVTDNLIYQETDKLRDRLLEGLEEDYIDHEDDFKMKSTNKGLKEIRISAAWMRGETKEEVYFRYNDETTDQPQKLAPLVGVEFTKSKHLRYMICLPRERFATILIDDSFNTMDKELFNRLYQIAPNDWEIKDNDLKIPARFIICSQDKYDTLRPQTSNRLMIWKNLDENNYSKLMKKTDHEFIEEMKNLIGQCFYGIKEGTEANPPIYIWDETAFNAHSGQEDLPDQLIKLFSSDGDTNDAQIAYRYHHSSEKEFMAFWDKRIKNDAYDNIKYIDEITGDNSSDRLVRREPLTKMWYYSHLYALKKKVAIFDERIFEMIHGIKEEAFKSTPEDVQKIILDLKSNPVETEEALHKIVYRINDTCNDLLLKYKENFKQTISKGNWQERINNFLLKKLENYTSDRKSENYKGIFYSLKGVEIFTVVSAKGANNRFYIIGRLDNLPKVPDTGESYGCLVGKIGEIYLDGEQCKVSIDDRYMDRFDYISVHQGILDKIYQSFGFKTDNSSSDKEVIQETKKKHRIGKLSVTKELFDKLMSHEADNNNHRAIGDYLPCFIIHSGRAKPSEDDMPQHQPFVQYAALEHGVQDCKFSLVELLDYARYEE